MAESRYTIRAILELLLKGKGAKDAKKDLDGAKGAARGAKDELKKADKAAAGLGKTLTRYLGGAILARFVLQSVQAFAKWERQLRTTAVEAERLGLSVSDTLRRVKELTIGIEEQTGILRQDTIPIFNKFLGLTGDVDQAAVLLRASVGAAEGGFKDLATAANLIGSILQGEVIEPSKSLGLAFDQATSSAEQQSIILGLALGKFLALSGGIDDTKGALDKMGAEANATKLTIGEQLAPALEWLSGVLTRAIQEVKALGSALGTLWAMGIQGAQGLANVISETFNVRRLISDPKEWLREIGQAVERELKLQEDLLRDHVEEEKRIRGEGTAGAVQTEKERQDAIDALLETANTRQQAAKDKAAKEAAEKELKAEVAMAEQGSVARLEAQRRLLEMQRANALEAAEETGRAIAEQFAKVEAEIEKKIGEGGSTARIAQQKKLLEIQRTNAASAAEKSARDVAAINAKYDRQEEAIQDEFDKRRVAFDQQISDQLLRQQIEAAEEGSEERLRLELEMLERLRKRAIDAAIEKEADVNQVKKFFDLAREGVIDEAEAKRLALGLKERKERLANSKKIISILKKEAAEEIAIQNAGFERDKQIARDKKQLALDVANQTLAIGRIMFGDSKAIAIAQAIVDAAAAIMNIQAHWAWNPPVAAALIGLAAATAVAQISAIRSAEPGSGSFHASGASGGGGFSASPAASIPAGGAAQPATTEREQPAGDTLEVHFHGTNIIDEPSLRRFMRKARRVESRDGARSFQ